MDWLRTAAIFVLLAGGGAVANAGWTQSLTTTHLPPETTEYPPDPLMPGTEPDPTEEEDECREQPGACILGTAAAELLGPVFETVFTDLHAGIQPPSAPFSFRIEHRARWIAGLAFRSHPFLGMGARSIRSPLPTPLRAPERVHLELAAGYQQSIAPIFDGQSALARSAVAGGEVQWLHREAGDRLRAQLNAGFEFHLPQANRLLVQVSVATTIRGPFEASVQPGVRIGYAW